VSVEGGGRGDLRSAERAWGHVRKRCVRRHEQGDGLRPWPMLMGSQLLKPSDEKPRAAKL
jgi:hypothetical protein